MTNSADPRSTLATIRTAQCDVHGPYVSLRRNRAIGPDGMPVWTPCCQCLPSEYDRRELVGKLQDASYRCDDWLRESGLCGRYESATFENFEAETKQQAQALRKCVEYVDSLDRCWAPLWLLGRPGTGKTHLLSAITRRAIESGIRARVITPRQFVRDVRDTWRRDSSVSETDVMDSAAGVTLLGLDDIGAGGIEPAEIHDLIDARYQRCLPTVIASNLKPEELAECVGARAYDRLSEGARMILCNWESRRGGVKQA